MNQQQHYSIPGTASSTVQQENNLLQEQEYQQLLFNQQQYLNSFNMPIIYNQVRFIKKNKIFLEPFTTNNGYAGFTKATNFTSIKFSTQSNYSKFCSTTK